MIIPMTCTATLCSDTKLVNGVNETSNMIIDASAWWIIKTYYESHTPQNIIKLSLQNHPQHC